MDKFTVGNLRFRRKRRASAREYALLSPELLVCEEAPIKCGIGVYSN